MASITFVHPDLGIGGAERLVVDAALALQKNGQRVKFVTNHHDPNHCFSETKDLLPVTVVGDWLPRSIFGKCVALCAYIRFIFAAFYIIFYETKPDVIFIDSISIIIPILRCFTKSRIIYYCHFPDQLLSKPGGILKQIYRIPLNFFEEFAIGYAHETLVNSQFTARVFKDTFTSLKSLRIDVLHPSINTNNFDNCTVKNLNEIVQEIPDDSIIFLSINRYERAKDLTLAVRAMASLKNMLSEQQFEPIYLIMAGGHDPRVIENIEYFNELTSLAKELKVDDKIRFLKSPSDVDKISLLNACTCLLYTPTNEHFGIVPLEAMYCKKPVIACNSGGPTETVIDKITGFLSEPQPKSYAGFMSKVALHPIDAATMGMNGRRRFEEKFQFDAFTNKLLTIITDHVSQFRKNK